MNYLFTALNDLKGKEITTSLDHCKFKPLSLFLYSTSNIDTSIYKFHITYDEYPTSIRPLFHYRGYSVAVLDTISIYRHLPRSVRMSEHSWLYCDRDWSAKKEEFESITCKCGLIQLECYLFIYWLVFFVYE